MKIVFWGLTAYLGLMMSGSLGGLPATAAVLQLSQGGTIGNQPPNGAFNVGVKFNVDSPITVTSIGIYDSGQNGIVGDLTAFLFSIPAAGSPLELESATFHGSNYVYVGHYAYQTFNIPLTLGVGTYYLGGIGWSTNDPEHNGFYSGNDESFVVSTLVTFLSAPYDPDNGTKFVPASDETGRNYFESANIQFDAATPLPATLPLFATGLGVLGLMGRRRKRQVTRDRS
jgi:hypothetical protein